MILLYIYYLSYFDDIIDNLTIVYKGYWNYFLNIPYNFMDLSDVDIICNNFFDTMYYPEIIVKNDCIVHYSIYIHDGYDYEIDNYKANKVIQSINYFINILNSINT